jgi:PIN domain nuclease of toxin-antitoxin system
MRVLLDTHIFIWYAKEQDKLSNNEELVVKLTAQINQLQKMVKNLEL